jgi:hypothetical protein
MPLASSLGSFLDAVGDFGASLAGVGWGSLGLGLLSFGVYLTLRSRAFFHILRAAYPHVPIQWRRIWGAYIAAYGFNNVVPARGGDVIKLFLTKTSIPGSSYPAVGASFFVEGVFDLVIGVFILAFAFSQGAFPKPPDFASLDAFDLSYLASHPRFTLFLLTVIGVLVVVAFALLSARVRAFWARVRQGLTILRDRRRYLREVFLVQLAGWGFRFTAFWFLLEAFGIGGSVRNVLLVLGVNAVAAVGAVHARRCRRAAGAARQGLRGRRDGSDGGRLLRRPADRHRDLLAGDGLRGARLRLQDPLVQGGHRPGTGVEGRRGLSVRRGPGGLRARG